MGHPSVSGMATGRGYSGSTAWHNSVRGRWYLTAPREGDGTETDPDLRQLALAKTSRGRPGARLALRWQDGWWCIDSGLAAAGQASQAKVRFLELLAEYAAQGRALSHKPQARNYAPVELARDERGLVRHGRTAYARAMDALLRDGALRIVMGPPGVKPSRQTERLEAA
jgi:hypothetical protein